jgi:diguanylate cyclase (GGDEF)-like protein
MAKLNASDRRKIAAYAAIVLVAVAGQIAIVEFRLSSFLADLSQTWGAVKLDEYMAFAFLAVFMLIAILVVRSKELAAEIRGRHEAESMIQRLARNDALTGLPNRRCFCDELERRIAAVGATGGQVAILFIDLDRFKSVNDAHGHAFGDRLLQAVTDRLENVCQSDEILARMSADEFAILSDTLSDRERPARLARRVLAALERTFRIDDRTVDISASVGIGLSDGGSTTVQTILQRADIALFRAKSSGRNSFAFYEAGFDAQVHARAVIEADLRRALRGNEIVPYFQPLVSIESGAVTGFEVLARWHSPEHGEIKPEDFIPVAEDTGLIGDVAWTLLRQACVAALNWDPAITIAVNLSPIQFQDPWLAQKVMAVLAETGFPAGRLEVEITENALVADFETARATVLSLKNQGVRIALDDFGTGYSSLHSLRELPFDKVKIDRSFVSTHSESDDSRKIVAAIVSLSHSLGLPTTAEGIETREDAEWLAALGCDQGQGFHYSRPLAAGEVVALLGETAAVGETELRSIA